MRYIPKFLIVNVALIFQLSILACAQEKRPVGGYKVVEAFPNLKFSQPVEFVVAPDGTDKIYVIEQKGIIKVFKNDAAIKKAETFLDITSQIVSGGERGLLGLAFHPDFKSNGYFYVNYTAGSNLKTYVSRFSVKGDNKEIADPKSELILFTFDQPFANHNGGKIAFGPDGYLYISAGDGGSGGDPQNNGQNLKTLLGKMIRIDVNKKDGDLNYSIPSDNPFKGNGNGYREEIYAYGLRNVWKFSFDEETKQLWAGDVGQNEREEIHIIKNGGNYGWKIMEGFVCFNSDTCDVKGLELPVYEYLHKNREGQSITGGYVYRGKKIKDLAGWYVYGDYVSGNIWRLRLNENGKAENQLIHKFGTPISSFGTDKDGELYICSHSDGRIFKLTTN